MQKSKIKNQNYNSKFKTFYFLLVLLFFNFSLFTFAQSAYAHVLKTDGTIGAVLHIDPDDDPVAGAQASFFFEFKDTSGKFDPKNCDCTGKILQNGHEIYASSLFQNTSSPSLSNASFFYTFPQRAVYTIQVTGKPTSGADFKPFTLFWDIRVDRSTNGSSSGQASGAGKWFSIHLIHLLLIIPAAAFMVYYILANKPKEKGGGKR